MDGIDFLIIVLVTLGAFALWLLGTAIFIWGERRIVAQMQSRHGPNRIGPFGMLQTLADGAKLFFKEDITPKQVDRWVYVLAPFISATVALMTFAVIPYGGTFTVGERTVTLQVWDPNIGILWVLAMSSLGVYGIVLAGWSSGSKYPLLGGVRSSAQMVSYELAMGLSVAAVAIYANTLRTSEIVAGQTGTLFGFLPAWHVIPMLPAFLIFFVTSVAETQRPPFDLPEAEGELVAGFGTEYSAAKFAMFYLAEFMNVITLSAVTVTLFFGGPSGPLFGPDWLRAIVPTIYFILKVFVFMFVFVWLRGTLPRLKYDRLMDLGWRVFLPLGLLWVLATAFVVMLRESTDQTTIVQIAIGGIAAAVVLWIVAERLGRKEEPEPPAATPVRSHHPGPLAAVGGGESPPEETPQAPQPPQP